jgi:predicted HAD superfamily Cof-like phosphohydrolase
MMTSLRAQMARAFQQGIGRTTPDAPTLRHLTANLRVAICKVVLEETLELISAMGCRVHTVGRREVMDQDSFEISFDPNCQPSIINILHESADVAYVNETITAMVGVDLQDVLVVLHESNMSKILPDGSLIRHPSRNHHPQYIPPDIEGVLIRGTKNDFIDERL